MLSLGLGFVPIGDDRNMAMQSQFHAFSVGLRG